MRLHCLFFLTTILVLNCSQEKSIPFKQSLFITSDKEIISDLDSLESNLFKYINTSSVQDIFEESWLYSVKTNYQLDKSISIEIKEHHPMASFGKDNYITQTGKSIKPRGKFKELKLVNIKGPEHLLVTLVDRSRELQTKLNQLGLRVISFELKNEDQFKATDDSGTEYIFLEKEFRVQLERLEDYISFELNSGKTDHIRYIDFRYNNAIAVFYS